MKSSPHAEEGRDVRTCLQKVLLFVLDLYYGTWPELYLAVQRANLTHSQLLHTSGPLAITLMMFPSKIFPLCIPVMCTVL